MAGIVDKLTAVAQAWWHYLKLGDTNIETARPAMAALKELGDASLPALRRGIRQHEDPRIQLRSAVVLHWLGQRDGLPVLIDALRFSSRSRKDPSAEITACYLMIGPPDATRALIEVWRQLPNLNDNDPTAVLICGIWHTLRDPDVLPAVCETSVQTPRLFIDIIAAFGAEAIPELRILACAGDPDRRALALRGLEKIPGYRSAQIIIPMLRDRDANVRALAPTALEAVSGPVTTLNALVEAHRAGFNTAASVQMLILYNPPELFALLAGLLTRYDPGTGTGTGTGTGSGTGSGTGTDAQNGDTVGAVREAALAFGRCPWPHAQVTQILCGAANRSTDPILLVAVAQTIAERGRAGDDSDILAYKTMWRQLAVVDRDARATAAVALSRLGEPVGKSFEALIDAGRPQGNLLRSLQSALVNSQDVGQAMTEAVQHVATWINRVSKVTAKRFSTDAVQVSPDDAVLADDRIPELLRRLQANVLESLERANSVDAAVEPLLVGVGAVKALARLESKAALIADTEITRTYTVVKLVGADHSASSGLRRGVGDDMAGVLREAAGEALIDIYGRASFDVLRCGLNHTEDAVKVTSAITLGRLGDRRAAPLLQSAADNGSPALSRAAKDAISAIRRENPEMMTLLRSSSSADARQDTLLRPSTGADDGMAPELLLRPGYPVHPE